MRVIEENPVPMTNVDVLAYIKRKRHRRADFAAQAKQEGRKPTAPPANVVQIESAIERHLASDSYPYTKNPTTYELRSRKGLVNKFYAAYKETVDTPTRDRYLAKMKTGEMSKHEAIAAWQKTYQKQQLTETELLMLVNHAPTCIEHLQPMIEEIEDRFTLEDQQRLVDCAMEALRAEEMEKKENIVAEGGQAAASSDTVDVEMEPS